MAIDNTGKNITASGKQQGIVLVVALLILVVMTILGVSMLGTSALEERMASNIQSQNITFQAAESCIRSTLLLSPAPGRILRDIAVANNDPVGNPNVLHTCSYDNNTINASVDFITPIDPANREALKPVRACGVNTCTSYNLTMAGTSTLNSGATTTVRVIGRQKAPKP